MYTTKEILTIPLTVYQEEGLAIWEKTIVSLLQKANNRKVWCLSGDLGAGKTTYIKAFCALLGVKEIVSSPTFSLINEYRDSRGDPIYHFDCYRLQTKDQAIAIGSEDYLHSSFYCLIEWPEVILPLLPPRYVHIILTPSDEGGRAIEVTYH